MAVVRPLQLVFDQHPAIGPDVLAEDVGTERSDRTSWASSSRSMPSVSPRTSRFSLRASQGVKSELRKPDIAKLDPFEATRGT